LGIAGQILYTPGHCIDHLAVVLESGEAFCGDAAGFLLLAGTRYCTVFMTDMNVHTAAGEKSGCWSGMIYQLMGVLSAGKLRQNMGCIKNRSFAAVFF
jgi:hypothetical protein